MLAEFHSRDQQGRLSRVLKNPRLDRSFLLLFLRQNLTYFYFLFLLIFRLSRLLAEGFESQFLHRPSLTLCCDRHFEHFQLWILILRDQLAAQQSEKCRLQSIKLFPMSFPLHRSWFSRLIIFREVSDKEFD